MADVFIILQLIFLEGILSLDNVAVLGAMVVHLPDDRPVPWPAWLRAPGRLLDRLLGPQQIAALRVGLLGAYLGRGLMLALAAWVVANPWLKLLGAFYLLKLAAAELGRQSRPSDEHGRATSRDSRFWHIVLAVELADLTFSLDNVVAAVTLSHQLSVVMLGVALGIVTMRFAAGIFTHLVQREPSLEPAAYILVLNISLEMLLEGLAGVHIGDVTKFIISAGTLALALVYAHWRPARAFTPLVQRASTLLRAANMATERAAHLIVTMLSMR